MISIVQKGQLPSEYRYRKTCEKCHTVFEFLQSDTQPEAFHHPMDKPLRQIKCPLHGCAKIATVSDRDRLTEIPSAATLTYPPGARSPFENRIFAPGAIRG